MQQELACLWKIKLNHRKSKSQLSGLDPNYLFEFLSLLCFGDFSFPRWSEIKKHNRPGCLCPHLLASVCLLNGLRWSEHLYLLKKPKMSQFLLQPCRNLVHHLDRHNFDMPSLYFNTPVYQNTIIPPKLSNQQSGGLRLIDKITCKFFCNNHTLYIRHEQTMSVWLLVNRRMEFLPLKSL